MEVWRHRLSKTDSGGRFWVQTPFWWSILGPKLYSGGRFWVQNSILVVDSGSKTPFRWSIRGSISGWGRAPREWELEFQFQFQFQFQSKMQGSKARNLWFRSPKSTWGPSSWCSFGIQNYILLLAFRFKTSFWWTVVNLKLHSGAVLRSRLSGIPIPFLRSVNVISCFFLPPLSPPPPPLPTLAQPLRALSVISCFSGPPCVATAAAQFQCDFWQFRPPSVAKAAAQCECQFWFFSAPLHRHSRCAV